MAKDKKDMSKLHNLERFSKILEKKNASLSNYASGGIIEMKWGMNDEASLDQIFAIKVRVNERDAERGYVEPLLDWQEVMHYGRAVSDWKGALERMKAEQEAARNG